MSVKSVAIFLIVWILYGCNEESPDFCGDKINVTVDLCEDVNSVSKGDCIIKEAIVRFLNGNQRERFVYFHDGVNYYKIDSHTLNNDGTFTREPRSTALLTYDQGKVIEVRISFAEHPGSYLKRTYHYAIPEVKIQSTYITDGVAGIVYEYSQFYLPQSKDSIYHHEEFTGDVNLSYLHEIRNGNRTRRASADEQSRCSLYGTNWKFDSKTYYDDQPNVLKEYAVRYPFNGTNGLPAYFEQFWVQTNANNMKGNAFDDGSTQSKQQYCWTFLRDPAGHLLVKKAVMEGTEITYTYDCE